MHKKKWRLRAVCAVLLIVSMIFSPVVLGYACYAAARPDDSGAGAVYLYCLSNASVLYSRDAQKEFPASSVTVNSYSPDSSMVYPLKSETYEPSRNRAQPAISSELYCT